MRAILNKLREFASELSWEVLGDWHKYMVGWAVFAAVAATSALIPYLMCVLLVALLTGALSANVLLLAVWVGFTGLAALSVLSLKAAQFADRLLDG